MSDRSHLRDLSINHYIWPDDAPVRDFIELVAGLGAGAVGLTARALDEIGANDLKRLLDDHGLGVSSLNSVGYFLHGDAAEAAARRDLSERLIEASAVLEAGSLTLIAGGLAHGDWTLEEARARVADGVAGLAERAGAAGVRLGLEPIHPMDTFGKGVVNTIAQALALAAPHDNVGLTLDLFHSWWDPDLSAVLDRAGDKVYLYQVCDVIETDPAMKPDRAPLGEGALDVGDIVRRVRRRGYAGLFEFELFPQHLKGRRAEDVIRAAAAECRDLLLPATET